MMTLKRFPKKCDVKIEIKLKWTLNLFFVASTVAGIATVDSNGRIQVVNKPITNTISNISFKCDVCGLMFSHLTLLNHHKRIHTQDGADGTNEQITVVTQQAGQNLVQGMGK